MIRSTIVLMKHKVVIHTHTVAVVLISTHHLPSIQSAGSLAVA